MIKKPAKKKLQESKHLRIRRKISGTAETPRLCIYKSLQHIYAQIIDDQMGVTLVAASTLEPRCAICLPGPILQQPNAWVRVLLKRPKPRG